MICSNCQTTESKRFLTTKEKSVLCYKCYRSRERILRKDKIPIERKVHYAKNKESILKKAKEYAQTNEYGYSYCKSNAKRRNISFDITFEQYCIILTRGCHYCKKDDLPTFGGRLDRLDSKTGYTFENCVGACAKCNYLKGDFLSTDETKAAVEALEKYHVDGILPEKIAYSLYAGRVQRQRPLEYSKLTAYAKKSKIECKLTSNQYLILASNPCYYCGGKTSQAGYGLDRRDPHGPYSIENCVACCPVCNKIKWDCYSPEETIVMVNAIQKVRIIDGKQNTETTPKPRVSTAHTKYHTQIKKDAYIEAKNLLEQYGLKLVTSFTEYTNQVNQKKVVSIECEKGHIFERQFERVRQILSCPDCTGKSNKHGGFLAKLKANGWLLLEGAYENKQSILTVMCKAGHKKVSQYRFLRDSSCAICRSNSLD